MGGRWYPPWEDILESLQDIKSEQSKKPPGTVQTDGEKEVRMDKTVYAPTEMRVRKTFSQASTIPASSIKSGPVDRRPILGCS